jgi:hypothetical protein
MRSGCRWRWNGGVGVGLWLVALLLTFALPCLSGAVLPSQDEIDAILDVCATNQPTTWVGSGSEVLACSAYLNPWPSPPPVGISQDAATGAITQLYVNEDEDVEWQVLWR